MRRAPAPLLALLLALHATIARAEPTLGSPSTPTPPAVEPEASGSAAPWVVLVASGVALGVGIGFGTASVVRHREARSLEQGFGDEGPAEEDREAYDAAIADRDAFRVVSGVAGGAALAGFVVTGVLFAIEEAGTAPSATALTAAPVVGPSEVGATLVVRF